MTDYARMTVIGGTIGVFVAGALVAPAVIAAATETPQAVAVVNTIEDLFPAPALDAKMFRKFDITLGPGVSTDIQRTQTIRKIGYGYSSTVTVVTTPSGTYSTDGLLSPNVSYPGIEVTSKGRWHNWSAETPQGNGKWTSFSRGSIIYLNWIAGPATNT